ncbi:MAG: hypothetical protein ABIY55_09730 [Kofleriaceae bacterium]
MALLPAARNTTYTAASPVRSVDLNDLQDCIIGKKFPSTPFYLPASSWRVVLGVATLDTGGVWTLGAGTQLVREISLAPGTRITSLIFSINRNSDPLSTGEFQLRLHSRTFGAVAQLLFTDIVSSGSAFALRDSIAATRAGAPIVTVDGAMYWLSVTATNQFSGPPMFDGAKLVCDRL